MSDVITRWHQLVEQRDLSQLDDWLADDVVFYSPVVHTPQVGKALARTYLHAASAVLFTGDFRYVRQVVGPNDAILEFTVNLDGIEVNGVDMICWNDEQKVTEFKVMLRPLQAINRVHERMGELLAARSR